MKRSFNVLCVVFLIVFSSCGEEAKKPDTKKEAQELLEEMEKMDEEMGKIASESESQSEQSNDSSKIEGIKQDSTDNGSY